MGNHIDQLAQWYADAEQITKTNLPNKGDTLISPYEAGGFGIEVERDGWTPDIVMAGEPVRILSRAPKPKPAWHDAVAVIAAAPNPRGVWFAEVWTRDGGEYWRSEEGRNRHRDDLRGVTPLIEAKVTDEMVERYQAEETKWRLEGGPSHPSVARHLLTAALGLETT